MSESELAKRLRLDAADPMLLPEFKADLLAAAEIVELARIRPISEAHEDYDDLILFNDNDPGDVRLSHVCALDWDVDSEGMTHFCRVPNFTLPAPPEVKP